MIKAVLLDLDDTLLLNPERQFVAAYLALIDGHFADIWQHEALSKSIMHGVKALVGQREAHLTNMDIVLNLIQTDTSRTNAEVIAHFNDFYTEIYPALKRLSAPAPGADELVDFLRERGIALVIATNPLFPPDAVRQRLAWANLPEDFTTYALVTTADVMHFMKPDPAYYAEIVARVGIEPDEALMVGDGIENDIIAASTAGLRTYYVTSADKPDDLPADGYGTLDNLRRMIYEDWLDTLPTHPPTPAMIAPELRGNVGALFGMLADVQPHFWQMHPDPAEWSILQIICHLLESESAVQRPRLQRILHEDNPFLAAPPPPMPDVSYVEGIGYEIAEQFAAERLKTLALVQQIAPEQWLRPARHSIFGPTTLLEMSHFTAQHDRLHLNQLCQTIGRCK